MNDENANIREILANMNSDDFNEEIEELEVFDDSLDVKKTEPVQTEEVEKFEEVKNEENKLLVEEKKVDDFEIPVIEEKPIVEDAPAVDIPEVQSDIRDDGMPSMIKMYGEVLTDKEYITNPAIARDEEINKMILALITPDKSAILVGKPGIGKTALVEG